MRSLHVELEFEINTKKNCRNISNKMPQFTMNTFFNTFSMFLDKLAKRFVMSIFIVNIEAPYQ